MFETKKNTNFVWAYTFLKFKYKIEKYASFQILQHSTFENWWSTWKDMFLSDQEGQNI